MRFDGEFETKVFTSVLEDMIRSENNYFYGVKILIIFPIGHFMVCFVKCYSSSRVYYVVLTLSNKYWASALLKKCDLDDEKLYRKAFL